MEDVSNREDWAADLGMDDFDVVDDDDDDDASCSDDNMYDEG